MGQLFSGGGGGGGGSAPAAVVMPKVAPSGPQLAPGQQYPGGPAGPVETDEQRKRRLAMLNQNVIQLGDAGGALGSGGTDGSSGVGGNAGDGDGGGSAAP